MQPVVGLRKARGLTAADRRLNFKSKFNLALTAADRHPRVYPLRPPPVRRFFVDPHDIEAAIERLTQLLAADTDGPRMDVPPGFYLNILV